MTTKSNEAALKPCSPCRFSSMCLVVGFKKMSKDIVRNVVAREANALMGTVTAQKEMEEKIKYRARATLDGLVSRFPSGCPGRLSRYGVEVTTGTGVFSVELETELDVLRRHPL